MSDRPPSGPPAQVPEGLEPSPEAIADAKAKVTKLLNGVGLKHLVCVDDDFEGSVTEVIAACAKVGPWVDDIEALRGVDFGAPQDIWEPEVREIWERLEQKAQRVLLAELHTHTGGPPLQQPDAGALQRLLPRNLTFTPATPAHWRAELQEKVLAAAAERPTLVLFDKDMGVDDGFKMAQVTFNRDTSASLWVGLLTNTVTKDGEHKAWQEYADALGDNADRFVVLSKQHLGPDPETFPQSLKVTLMSKPAASLLGEVASAIRDSAVDALNDLEKLSPQEFERIIFEQSGLEGVWEPDTLLRLFDACVRRGTRARLHNSHTVRELALTLRGLSDVKTKSAPTTEQANAIFRKEIYEDRHLLNRAHLPVELGDIFQIKTRWFILVGQPCDLMVRSQPPGKRTPELLCATLVPLITTEKAGANAKTRSELVELFSFHQDGSSMWAHLGRPEVVPIEALDYCVFDRLGRSTLDTEAEPPDALWPAWAARHGRLVAAGRKIIAAVESVPQAQRGQAVIGQLRTGTSSTLTGEVCGNTISYHCQRKGRLLPGRSRLLLTRFAQHQARDAFPFVITQDA